MSAAETPDRSPPGGPPGGSPGTLLRRLSAGLALAGGALLCGLAVLTCLSIAGRVLLSAPLPGDFELIEAGTAVAVFAFLPWCQVTRGNVAVDLLVRRAPPRARAALSLAANAAFTAVAALLTWQAALGGRDLHRYRESTMVLGLPLWWGFVPATFCLAVLTLVCLATALDDLRALKRGAGPRAAG